MLFHEVNETLLGHEYDDRLSREKKNFVTVITKHIMNIWLVIARWEAT